MKKKITIISLIFCLILALMFLFSNNSYAGSQDMQLLTYNVQLNEDGSADVTEKWNITVEDTNTLFKTFELDSTKYGEITNVKVSEISRNGRNTNFIPTSTYAYHVAEGKYYALKTKSNEFEIAWGVSIDGSKTTTYQISYKIENAVKKYTDCSEFYWQFIGTTNGIPVDSINGTIKLPKAVASKENLKVWAHGPLNRRNTNCR